MDERLEQQIDFIREIDKAKSIWRQTYISDGTRRENDAEHSWHMAVMAFLLSEHANSDIDVLKTIKMILIHDIVEIDAGDTYAYDEKAHETKKERECAAADRLFGILPKDQGELLRSLWDEFEANETPEARFAHSLDNLQPILLNDASDGLAWREHGVHSSQIYKRNEITELGSKTLWNYVDGLIKKNMDTGNIIRG